MPIAFVIPVFDNCDTVAEVVGESASLGYPVYVVDDGSTDGTAERLGGLDGVTVLRHETNRGKGAALRTGMTAAARAGADWAITVDADGQHAPREAPKLLAALEAGERPIVVGFREGMDAPNTPWKSRFGRKFSNFWIRASGGHPVNDSQSGFRLYPLPETLWLGARTDRFQFEVETLVLARWKGIPTREVPISVHYPPPDERVSHYRPFVDFCRNTGTFTRLICRRIFTRRAVRARLTPVSPHDG